MISNWTRRPGMQNAWTPHKENPDLWLDPSTLTTQPGYPTRVATIFDRIAGNNATPPDATGFANVTTLNGVAGWNLDGGVHNVPHLARTMTGVRTIIMAMQQIAGASIYSTVLGADAIYNDFQATDPLYFFSGGPFWGANGGCVRVNGEYMKPVEQLPLRPTSPAVVVLQTSAANSVRFNNLGMDRITSRVNKANYGDVFAFKRLLSQQSIANIERYLARKYSITFAPKNVVVCTGNSLTYGQGASYSVSDYPTQLAALVTNPSSWYVWNEGISGQTTAQLIQRDAMAVGLKLSESASKKIVVVWEGTNDLCANGVDQAIANLKTEAELCRMSGAKVGVGTILPRSNAGVPSDFEARRQTVNAAIRSIFGANCIDIAADSDIGAAGAETNTTYYCGDNVHMNATGYGRVASIVAAWVNAQ